MSEGILTGKNNTITMLHGSGGSATGELIREVFASAFGGEELSRMEDAAVVDGLRGGRLAVTTDSFVVTPLFYRGGDIGRLAVCGTVNDLLMRGAVPKYLTCGWILEEGASVDEIRKAAQSMAETAREAGVAIVAGDTKVIEGSRGGFYINTAGVGEVCAGVEMSAGNAGPGDVILVSGTLGDHHAAILSARMEIENEIVSDTAPLTEMAQRLRELGTAVHTMRDVTRGGLATVCKELAGASRTTWLLRSADIPVRPQVRDFCGLLGLDPLYMGNEGKLVCAVERGRAQEALEAIRSSRYGEEAAVIGEVTDERAGALLMETEIGGRRELEILQGEGLPRIC